jgi:hypothetical protein
MLWQASDTATDRPWVAPTSVLKAYYFTSHAAVVCIFPYFNVYFNSRGFSEKQIGVLTSARPWVAALAGPRVLGLPTTPSTPIQPQATRFQPLLMLGNATVLFSSPAMCSALPYAALLAK